LWIAGAAAAGALVLFGPPDVYAAVTSGPKLEAAIRVQADLWGAVFGVPSAWIMAIAKIESNYRPGATNLSSAGDVKRGGSWGAMQVSLATAIGIAAELGKSSDPNVRATLAKWTGEGPSLLLPDVGVMFGASLLARLAKEFQSFDLTAAAYNAGAGAVRKRIAAGKHPFNLAYVAKAAAALEAIA
jgi:soluble lytic murein transglycosylase-like protein